jgi:hypothetical protein
MLHDTERYTGQRGLIDRYRLQVPKPYQISIVGARARKTEVGPTNLYNWYRDQDYGDTSIGDLHFALRWEAIDLAIVKAAFHADWDFFANAITDWLEKQPTSAFARRAWFLFEFLTDRVLPMPDSAPINYVSLLDSNLQITLEPAPDRSPRHRIEINLIGNQDFCPLIRRTPEINSINTRAAQEAITDLMPDGDEDLFRRAVSYLYTKETRASYEIESEKPSDNKILRFIDALRQHNDFDFSSTKSYIETQNMIILNPDFRAKHWRTEQVYIGESTVRLQDRIHCIFPKPGDIQQLMDGFQARGAILLAKINPIIAAAVLSFGFVFIHPFLDGNGRLHRFLIHQALAKTKVTPEGIIFPISATMLRKRAKYDAALESFSKRIMPFIEWDWSSVGDGSIVVTNETIDLYRYFDATDLCIYLNATILESIRVDLKEELDFMRTFDAAFGVVDEYLDGLPQQKVRSLIRYILQNNGQLSKNKRAHFPELSDARIARTEELIAEAVAPPS